MTESVTSNGLNPLRSGQPANVRFSPESGQTADISVCPLCANSVTSHRSKYSAEQISDWATTRRTFAVAMAVRIHAVRRRLDLMVCCLWHTVAIGNYRISVMRRSPGRSRIVSELSLVSIRPARPERRQHSVDMDRAGSGRRDSRSLPSTDRASPGMPTARSCRCRRAFRPPASSARPKGPYDCRSSCH